MAYRITNRARERIQLMRAAKDAKRTSGSAPDYPAELPVLRRRIVVTDFDFGEQAHVLELYRTNRVDCYRVVADGVEWKRRAGGGDGRQRTDRGDGLMPGKPREALEADVVTPLRGDLGSDCGIFSGRAVDRVGQRAAPGHQDRRRCNEPAAHDSILRSAAAALLGASSEMPCVVRLRR